MIQLTCSRLSSYRIVTATCPWGRLLALVLLTGGLSVQAQGIDQTQKKIESAQQSMPLLPTSELPAQAVESNINTAKQKPNFFNRTSNWLSSRNLPGDLQIHGFASQGYITTSDNDVFGNSNNGGSFGLTEAGLNISVRPLPKLQLSAQVLSRRAGKGNSGMPRLDYAILDYQLYSYDANQYGIRVGRLKNPFGFYNETRDVAHTRPSILLPQSIYFDRTRNLGLSGDSVQLYGETAIGNFGTFSTQFGVWWPIVNDRDTEVSLIGRDPRVPSDIGNQPIGQLNREASYIGRGIFETNDKRLRLGISGIWLNTSYDPRNGLKDPISAGSLQFTPIYFSAQYNAERWSITSEYAIRHFKYDNTFGPMVLNNADFFGESYYVQGEYRFTPKWEGFIRYDVLYADRSDRNGNKFAKEFGVAPHSRFAKDITVGLRWNVTPEFMLRAEYHRVNGTGWLSRLDNPTATEGPMSQHWDLYAIQASYRF